MLNIVKSAPKVRTSQNKKANNKPTEKEIKEKAEKIDEVATEVEHVAEEVEAIVKKD